MTCLCLQIRQHGGDQPVMKDGEDVCLRCLLPVLLISSSSICTYLLLWIIHLQAGHDWSQASRVVTFFLWMSPPGWEFPSSSSLIGFLHCPFRKGQRPHVLSLRSPFSLHSALPCKIPKPSGSLLLVSPCDFTHRFPVSWLLPAVWVLAVSAWPRALLIVPG